MGRLEDLRSQLYQAARMVVDADKRMKEALENLHQQRLRAERLDEERRRLDTERREWAEVYERSERVLVFSRNDVRRLRAEIEREKQANPVGTYLPMGTR